jgi:hypothetical protein
MATLPVKVVPHAGLSIAPGGYTPAGAAGDQAATGPGVLLLASNGSGAAVTVTLTVPETVDSLPVQARGVTIPAGATGLIPLLDLYRSPSSGLAAITYSAVASVTVAVIRVA